MEDYPPWISLPQKEAWIDRKHSIIQQQLIKALGTPQAAAQAVLDCLPDELELPLPIAGPEGRLNSLSVVLHQEIFRCATNITMVHDGC